MHAAQGVAGAIERQARLRRRKVDPGTEEFIRTIQPGEITAVVADRLRLDQGHAGEGSLHEAHRRSSFDRVVTTCAVAAPRP